MDNKRKAAVAVACTLGASFAISSSYAVPVLSEDGTHTYDDDIVIPTLVDPTDPDNNSQLALPANIRIPTSNDLTEKFPLLIFISSWSLDEYEYSNQAAKFAAKGYAVLSYTARGFRAAPGEVNTAGEKDIYDARQAITYALENYPIDEAGIALAGVSYGAGISLLTGFQDERVDAIVSMSGWGSLVESLWAGTTPMQTWINLLINSGHLTGDLDPIVEENYNNMKLHQNIEETKAWGMIRSPLNYIDLVNSRENPPALFASNNLHDYLFQPNSMVELLSKYQGPWRCEFNYGTHGQGEAGGILDGESKNVPWKEAHQWLDHYLKGVDNGIDQLKPVNTVVRATTNPYSNRESFASFPVSDKENHMTLYLSPAVDDFGTLSDIEDLGFETITFDTTQSIVATGALQGALFGSAHNYPIDDINLNHSVAFIGPILEDHLHIRGEINLELWVEAQDKAQYFAYLLEYEPDTNRAIYIGHAPFTWHNSEFGEPPLGPTKINLEFYWTTYDAKQGNQLMLVIEGKDGDYWRYADTPEYNTLVFGPENISKLIVPTIPEPVPYLTVEDPDGSESDPNARSLDGAGSNYGPGGGAFGYLMLLICSLLGLSRTRLLRIPR